MNKIKKINSIIVAFLFITITFHSASLLGDPNEELEDKELSLLRVEHYFSLEATQDTNTFNALFVFPPDYNYQVPVVIEMMNETTANIISYSIDDYGVEPNKVINFTVGPIQENEIQTIHFSIWVLVEHHDFLDIPNNILLPSSKHDVPMDTWEWLSRSNMVQVHRLPIKIRANKLEGNNEKVLSYAQNVSSFIKNHRYGLFLIQLWTRMFLKQDALTTLRINGENVGRSHLACALLRTKNIPARVVLAHNDQGFWTQMHYMVEYYIPNYGWVLLDSTKGATPYPTSRQVINRLCSIEDEDDTKKDYILPFMKGEERWIWIDSNAVEPYYVDCDEGSKSQMFTETISQAKPFAVDYSFFRTENVFNQYEKYLGKSLTIEDQEHINNAIDLQVTACKTLSETNDLNDYVFYIEQAYDEYKLIE